MTHRDFTYWLQGLLVGKTHLTEDELTEVNKKLVTVGEWPNFGWNWQYPHTGDWGGSPQILDTNPLEFHRYIAPVNIDFPIVQGT
jgi:hypothetical protein